MLPKSSYPLRGWRSKGGKDNQSVFRSRTFQDTSMQQNTRSGIWVSVFEFVPLFVGFEGELKGNGPFLGGPTSRKDMHLSPLLPTRVAQN